MNALCSYMEQKDAIMNTHTHVSSPWAGFSLGYPSIVLLGYNEHESPAFQDNVTLLMDMLPAVFKRSCGPTSSQYLPLSKL